MKFQVALRVSIKVLIRNKLQKNRKSLVRCMYFDILTRKNIFYALKSAFFEKNAQILFSNYNTRSNAKVKKEKIANIVREMKKLKFEYPSD